MPMSTRKAPISKDLLLARKIGDIRYNLACVDPYLWICKAKEVRRAADFLWQQFLSEIQDFSSGKDLKDELFGSVALMLYGLVVEILLKAGLAAKGLAISSTGKFGKKSHNLQSLAQDLGLRLSNAENELLERLQNFVEWAGRYPIPLRKEGLYPRDLLDGSKCSLCNISTGDEKKIAKLLLKIEELLPSEEKAIENYFNRYRVSP
jgi:hypothetical protein